MSKFCVITKKKTIVGNNVSKSNIRTKRKFYPNIQKIKLWSEKNKRFYKIKISCKGLKNINKYGIEKYLRVILYGKKNKDN